MSIHVLEKQVIDLIAAGEVVERPSSVVKELVENAIDAGADAITVEIRNGGIDLIRVTDNGSGIQKDEIRTAFRRHATSKIGSAEDLQRIGTLGFRGEALSSISAVSRLELITRTEDAAAAVLFSMEGGEEKEFSEIGAPLGTTFLVRDLFFNTPARRKFLKTPMTEASYVSDLAERFALSHPEISFRLIINGNQKLSTSGSGKLKELIYTVYGRDTVSEIIPLQRTENGITFSGCLGKPVLAKGNRGFENFFINGRYVKSDLISKAAEEAYRPYMMQHRYPFLILYLELSPEEFDVNVHPTKMELRFRSEGQVYDAVLKTLSESLREREFIRDVRLTEEKEQEEKIYRAPEPFETNRLKEEKKEAEKKEKTRTEEAQHLPDIEIPASGKNAKDTEITAGGKAVKKADTSYEEAVWKEQTVVRERQTDLFTDRFLSEEGRKKHRLIGQLFETYWLIEMDDKLFILDQHAAHEKVLYERKMKALKEKKHSSQAISPPVIVTLSAREELLLNRYADAFTELGYEISAFGGRDYAVSGVPADLFGLDVRALFSDILGSLNDELDRGTPEMILSKVASMSCKAAVKGSTAMSFAEADALIAELMTLENPYACPHGRPTLISLTKYEIEKKFGRIVS